METPSPFKYLLCGLTITLNAALLFIAQPMMSKMLLPLVGGAPAVWTTSILYYQVILLAGYAYVRILSHAAPRYQFGIHILLLLLAQAQPLTVRSAPVTVETAPTLWTIATLTISVGAPLLVLSAGAPLLQVWFAET